MHKKQPLLPDPRRKTKHLVHLRNSFQPFAGLPTLSVAPLGMFLPLKCQLGVNIPSFFITEKAEMLNSDWIFIASEAKTRRTSGTSCNCELEPKWLRRKPPIVQNNSRLDLIPKQVLTVWWVAFLPLCPR